MTSSSSNMDSSSSSSSPKRKAGRKKFKETRHPIYRGVRARNNGKWVCEVREPNKKSRIWLGTYPTPEMAARAHDVAAIALRGESAALNFADSGRVLPRARSRRVDDIRHAASQGAEMYRQREGEQHAVAADTMLEGGRPTVEVEPRVFVDEEAMLDMPGLLREMAEGMMVTPPGMVQGSGGFDYWYDSYTDHSSNRVDDGDEGCGNSGMSLWSN